MSSQNLREVFRSLNSKNIVYNKVYYELTQSFPAAILLSHLAYLSSECFGGKEFYQSDNQLKKTLAFSDANLRTAKKHLCGFATSIPRGMPAKNHWVVHEDLIIKALIAYQKGKPSFVDIDTTSFVDIDTTSFVDIDNRKKQELPKKQELHKNNNNVADDKLVKLSEATGVNRIELEELLNNFPKEQVALQLRYLARQKNIASPIAWMIAALKKGYQAPSNDSRAMPTPMAPASHEIWDPSVQRKRNAEVEKMSDPNDWRQQLIDEGIKKITKRIKCT